MGQRANQRRPGRAVAPSPGARLPLVRFPPCRERGKRSAQATAAAGEAPYSGRSRCGSWQPLGACWSGRKVSPGGLRTLRPARVRRLTRTRAGTLTKVYFVSSEGAKGSASRRPPRAGGRAVRAPPGGRGGGCAAAGPRGPRPPGLGTAPARLAGTRGIWAWEAARSANKVPSGKRGP